MTSVQLQKYIGREGIFAQSSNIKFRVRVVDAKHNFGRLDFLIAPVAGEGERWASETTVILDKKGAK